MESSANLADTSFLLSCMRCNQLLHDGDRYCPSCGQDQLDTGLDPWASRPAPLYAVGGATEVEHIELPLAGPFTSPLSAAGLAFIDPSAAAAAPVATTRPDQAQGAPPARRPARANVAVRLGLGIGALAITALAAGMAHDLYRTLRAPVPVPMPLRAASSAALTATTPAGEPPAVSKAALAAAPAPAPIAVLEPVASVPEAKPQRAPAIEPVASVPEPQFERAPETALAPEPGPAAVPAHSPEPATTPEAEPDPAPQPDLVPTASAPPQPAEPPATGQASAPPGQCHEALAAMGLCLNR